MRKSFSHLLLIILLSGFFSACAHQPASSTAVDRQEIECASLSNDSSDFPENKHCYDDGYDSDYDQSYAHEHDYQNESTRSFGLLIFQAVVEGLVEGILLGILQH